MQLASPTRSRRGRSSRAGRAGSRGSGRRGTRPPARRCRRRSAQMIAGAQLGQVLDQGHVPADSAGRRWRSSAGRRSPASAPLGGRSAARGRRRASPPSAAAIAGGPRRRHVVGELATVGVGGVAGGSSPPAPADLGPSPSVSGVGRERTSSPGAPAGAPASAASAGVHGVRQLVLEAARQRRSWPTHSPTSRPALGRRSGPSTSEGQQQDDEHLAAADVEHAPTLPTGRRPARAPRAARGPSGGGGRGRRGAVEPGGSRAASLELGAPSGQRGSHARQRVGSGPAAARRRGPSPARARARQRHDGSPTIQRWRAGRGGRTILHHEQRRTAPSGRRARSVGQAARAGGDQVGQSSPAARRPVVVAEQPVEVEEVVVVDRVAPAGARTAPPAARQRSRRTPEATQQLDDAGLGRLGHGHRAARAPEGVGAPAGCRSHTRTDTSALVSSTSPQSVHVARMVAISSPSPGIWIAVGNRSAGPAGT